MEDRDDTRVWQASAIETIKRHWDENPSYLALVAACPGAGKTRMGCMLLSDFRKDKMHDAGIILAPTVNIQKQWVKALTAHGIRATDKATNERMRWRQKIGTDEIEGYEVIVVTYAQLVSDITLFLILAERRAVLLIADEIHHADEDAKYGQAVANLAEVSKFRLSLSGTPFNSSGGALAMCESEEIVDDEGRRQRRTKATVTYDYGNAITDRVCRPVEFIKVDGRGEATYRSLANNTTFKRLVDLANQTKADRLGLLIDADGAYAAGLIRHALEALSDLKLHDRRAAMLVVARDITHAKAVARRIAAICDERPEWKGYTIDQVYSDTEQAHERIEKLSYDNTDIIVSVRMISEGVDITRLRVGLYLTDYLTRMFFAQFVGRFARWEKRLDRSQHARVIIPAHVELLKYAREIEIMIDAALIPDEGHGGGVERKNEFLYVESEAGDSGLTFRGEENNDRPSAQIFFESVPSLRGLLTETQAILAAQDLKMQGAGATKPDEPQTPNWSKLNDDMARAIVRRLKANGESDENLFAKVNAWANRSVGIRRKDPLTAEDVLIRRHAIMKQELMRIIGGEADNIQ